MVLPGIAIVIGAVAKKKTASWVKPQPMADDSFVSRLASRSLFFCCFMTLLSRIWDLGRMISNLCASV